MSSKFSWDLSGLNQARFRAYSSLLNLRNGGQLDSRLEAEHELEDKRSLPACDDSDSVVAQTIVSFDETQLKESFQDRVAEIVSSAKGGYHVAATLLFSSPEGVKLVVAKSEGFNKSDKEFLRKLQDALKEISKTSGLQHDDPRSALWTEILTYSNSRLNDWIAEFQRVARKFSNIRSENCIDVHSEKLRSEVLGLLETSLEDSKSTVVWTAHAMWNAYGQLDFDHVCNNQPELAKNLRLSIGFLGRLRIGFNIMVRAAERLDDFQQLTIYPLESWSGKKLKTLNRKGRLTNWTFNKTLHSLSKSMDDANIKLLLGRKRTEHELITEFDKIQTRSRQIHAEIQLVLYAAQQSLEGVTHSGYIGCSKRSCFLCSHFLKAYGSFRTRGSHGKIYNVWTIPEAENLSVERLRRLICALKSTEILLKNNLCAKEPQDKPPHAKESSVGGCSIATRMPFQGSPYATTLVSQYLAHEKIEAERERKVKGFDPNSLLDEPYDQEPSEPGNPTTDTNSVVETGDYCRWCEKWTETRCPRCGKDWYCSTACSAKSVSHRFACAYSALTTADYLELAVLHDEIPDDPQTMEDYGFDRCKTWNEKSHLLGLYIGLFKGLDISSQDLDNWRKNGKLIDNIMIKYNKIPEGARGGYFPWFLKHKHILEKDPVEPKQPEKLLLDIIQKAGSFLQLEDQEKHFTELQPAEKRISFIFFAFALEHMYPNPMDPNDLWYRFGFCTCADEGGQQGLGSLYSKLLGGNKFLIGYDKSLGVKSRSYPDLSKATFDEFRLAFWDGKLLELMDQYGLREERQRFRHLDSFLAVRPTDPQPLVWRLCHFLAFEPTEIGIPTETLEGARYYGFSSELGARRTLELRSLYKSLMLEGDLLELDSARSEGKLCDYARKHVRLEEDIERVLRRLK